MVYLDDDNVQRSTDQNTIDFNAGDLNHIPTNPENCDRFIRFDSTIRGKRSETGRYILEVCELAEKYFGKERVHFYRKVCEKEDEEVGLYSWAEFCYTGDELFRRWKMEWEDAKKGGGKKKIAMTIRNLFRN